MTVFDAARLEAGRGNAIVWQTLLEPSTNRLSLDEVTLVRGRQYVLSVTVLGETAERLAFGSKRFVGQ